MNNYFVADNYRKGIARVFQTFTSLFLDKLLKSINIYLVELDCPDNIESWVYEISLLAIRMPENKKRKVLLYTFYKKGQSLKHNFSQKLFDTKLFDHLFKQL